jgi:glycosyltransferase involved in cell wall biosynthesis
MSRKPRLLFFENNPAYFLTHRAQLARAAAAQGYEVHVASMPGPAAADIQAAGFTHHPVVFTRSGINPLVESLVVWRVIRLYQRINPDLAYQVTIKPVLYGTLAARWAHVQAVVSVVSGLGYIATGKGWRITCLRHFAFLFYRLALRHKRQRIIFQNRDDLELFTRRGIINSNETMVIPGSGVDTDYFKPSEEAAGTPVVVLPARMLRDKGVNEFVSAAAILRKAGVRARFLLAGGTDPGNPGTISDAQLRRWDKEGNIEWLGQVMDMRDLFSKCHVVCLPSYREGIPRVLLEAAASGRPIVTTNVPGCRDAVLEGKTGVLVPAQNSHALAAALQQLIEDAHLRKRLGAKGRLMVERRFSAVRVVAETLDMLRTLVRASS